MWMMTKKVERLQKWFFKYFQEHMPRSTALSPWAENEDPNSAQLIVMMNCMMHPLQVSMVVIKDG